MKNVGINSKVKLYNSVEVPLLGFGVFQISKRKEFFTALNAAISVGYRHFDTASIYGNESLLGKVIIKSKIPRNEFFITSKLWKSDFGYNSTIASFYKSLLNLQTDYLDLYLLHWSLESLNNESWHALEYLYDSGKIRAIGVSNFTIQQLQNLSHNCRIIPMVNQIEHHPYLVQYDLIEYCKKNHIQIIAHSPLMWGKILNDNLIADLSLKYGKSPAQIILRWNLQKGIPSIPKSSNIERIMENADIFCFFISDEDMSKIDSLNRNYRIGGKP